MPRDFDPITTFLRTHGTTFTAGDCTPWDGERGEARACFKNAALAVMRNPQNLRYVEGYMYLYGLPILHAWVLRADGRWSDPTVAPGEAPVYVGAVFSYQFMCEELLASGVYGLLDKGRGPDRGVMERYAEAHTEMA